MGKSAIGLPPSDRFTTNDCVVVQEVEMKVGNTRFLVHKVEFSEWHTIFVEWIDEDHDRYLDCAQCWDEGWYMYGVDPPTGSSDSE